MALQLLVLILVIYFCHWLNELKKLPARLSASLSYHFLVFLHMSSNKSATKPLNIKTKLSKWCAFISFPDLKNVCCVRHV